MVYPLTSALAMFSVYVPSGSESLERPLGSKSADARLEAKDGVQ